MHLVRPRKGGRGTVLILPKHAIMPKHKKDKHAQSISKGFKSEQPGVPPTGEEAGRQGDNKAFQQHDAANRLGSFEGTGNHARTGNRGHQ